MTRFAAVLCSAIAVCAPGSSVLHAVAPPAPAGLMSSTYYGGFGYDEANDVVVDAGGFVYVAGWSESPGASGIDGFVLKLTADGSQIVYSTRLGGSGFDIAMGLALDPAGGIWVVGHTTSPDFPLLNAFQPTLRGDSDAWIAKLDAEGALVFSTYYGGSSFENGVAIAVGPLGAIHVAGDTGSVDLDLRSTNALQPAFGGGFSDAFVVIIKSDLSGLGFGTYLGGSGDDQVSSIAVDASGYSYLAGLTRSSDFPLGLPIQDTYGGGASDAFITKLIPDLSHLAVSTYLGGSDSDSATGLALDKAGAIYATGSTWSADFPTLNAYKAFHSGGVSDAFLIKLRADGRSAVYSTFFGGDGYDAAEQILVGLDGNAHISGGTDSVSFPLVGAVQDHAGGFDAFYAELAADGQALLRSTPLGGAEFDVSRGLALNPAGEPWIAGRTESVDFPIVNAFQPSPGGLSDAFVSRLALAPPMNQAPTADAGPDQLVYTTGCAANVTLDGSRSRDPDGDPLQFAWSGDISAAGPVITVSLLPGDYTFTLTVDDGRGGISSDVVNVSVIDNGAPEIASVTATPSALRPPNHQMIDVSVGVGLTGACNGSTVCHIVSVASNEAINGLGDGDTAPDWQVTGQLTLQLRAERGQHPLGRIYSITIECVDAAGNRSQRTVVVSVPRS